MLAIPACLPLLPRRHGLLRLRGRDSEEELFRYTILQNVQLVGGRILPLTAKVVHIALEGLSESIASLEFIHPSPHSKSLIHKMVLSHPQVTHLTQL